MIKGAWWSRLESVMKPYTDGFNNKYAITPILHGGEIRGWSEERGLLLERGGMDRRYY
jgi:hypothetical protein